MVELPKAKRKPGRPKGSTKWPGSGRQKGTINRTTAELRRYIHRNANPVGQVCKIAKGKLTLDGLSQADAIRLLYKAVIPELKADILSGPDDGPIRTEDATRLDMVELGRRAAYLLDLAGRDTGEAGREGHSETRGTPPNSTPRAPVPHSGHTPPENSEKNLEKNSARNPIEARLPDSASRGATALGGGLPPSALAPAPTTSEPDTPSTSGFSHEVVGAHSDVYGWVEGGHAPRTSEPAEANDAAPELSREPVPGEVADVGDFTVHCHEGTREGLPPTYQIRGDRGQIHAQAVGGWMGALAWVKRHSPDGADLTPVITRPRPLGGGSRPDEYAARTVSAPVVVGSYEHRKR